LGGVRLRGLYGGRRLPAKERELYVPKKQYFLCANLKTGKDTCAISSDVLIIRALLFRFVTTESTAMVIPRLRSIAFIPAATDLHPSANIARVRTVAQVVPEKLENRQNHQLY